MSIELQLNLDDGQTAHPTYNLIRFKECARNKIYNK